MRADRYPLALHGRHADGLSLAIVAERAGIHPLRVQHYVEYGLIEPRECVGEHLRFTPETVLRLRCIERLRRDLGVNLAGVALVLDLVERIRRLEQTSENRCS